jgi:hypothetical protein
MRFLPFLAIPQPGESLTSVVGRTLDIVGTNCPAITASDIDWRRVSNFACHAEVTTWSQLTGLPAERLIGCTYRTHQEALPLYADILKGNATMAAVARKTWLWPGTTQACPECLVSTDNAWRLKWRLPWVFSCPEHQRLLTTSCPVCGQLLREHHQCPRSIRASGYAWSDWIRTQGPAAQTQPAPPTLQRTNVLTQSWTSAASRINAALDGIPHATAGEPPRTPADYLDSIRSLAGLYFHLDQHNSTERQQRRRAVAAPPRDSSPRAQLIARASTTLALPHELAVARLTRELATVRPAEGLTAWIGDHALRTPTTARLFDSITSTRTSIGRTRRAHITYPTHVPQQIWPDTWLRLRPMLTTSTATGRTFASMLVVKTQQQCTWKQAAAMLGIPATLAHNIPRTGTARTTVHATTLVDELLHGAQAHEPIDYRRRERIALHLHHDNALNELRQHLKAPHLSDLMLRERVWTDWALGHPALAARPHDTPRERERTANQRKRWTPQLADQLQHWCTERAGATDSPASTA